MLRRSFSGSRVLNVFSNFGSGAFGAGRRAVNVSPSNPDHHSFPAHAINAEVDGDNLCVVSWIVTFLEKDRYFPGKNEEMDEENGLQKTAVSQSCSGDSATRFSSF